MKSIAFFITSHGYGHAARAAGIMTALRKIVPAIRFEIFTTVPRVFFETSVGSEFGFHEILTDIGLIQSTPTQEDIPATLNALAKLYPFNRTSVTNLAQTIANLKCSLVVCDISPLGIVVAREAGVPSVLVENFRWDWIYENYQKYDDRFTKHIDYLRDIFESVDHLIQSEPVCVRHRADLTTLPISRRPRKERLETRTSLGIPPDDQVVYISMGGSSWDASFLKDLQGYVRHAFIISGGNVSPHRLGNLLFLDINTYMPDVLASCDAVICKVGYSTLAETYYAGIPFGYVSREQFQESKILEEYIRTDMQGMKIIQDDFFSGEFIHHIDEILSLPRIERDHEVNGAFSAAWFINDLL
jgi:hypothetical protein